MTTRREFLNITALTLAAGSFGTGNTVARAEDEKAQLMFVQTAEDLQADEKTLRLINVGQQILYFSDRPVRLAGHMTMATYINEWTPGAGVDNFTANPPNATLSVLEAGKSDNTLVVVEISQPDLVGSDIIYQYRLIEGEIPKTGGVTALFIDMIGIGGGIGPGFHGVGVGRRGVGIR